ncbi:hypothetical protein KUCAC02_032246, partial [Chaenocephalus aceratus]
ELSLPSGMWMCVMEMDGGWLCLTVEQTDSSLNACLPFSISLSPTASSPLLALQARYWPISTVRGIHFPPESSEEGLKLEGEAAASPLLSGNPRCWLLVTLTESRGLQKTLRSQSAIRERVSVATFDGAFFKLRKDGRRRYTGRLPKPPPVLSERQLPADARYSPLRYQSSEGHFGHHNRALSVYAISLSVSPGGERLFTEDEEEDVFSAPSFVLFK